MRQSEPRRSGKPAADEAAVASSPHSAEERIRELEAELAGARRAQELAEARYAAMTANAPVGVAVLGLDGRFSDVNPTLCALTGHAPEEIVGHFPTEFSPPDQVERSRAQFQKLIGGSGLELAEVELRHKHGHAVWVMTAYVPDRRIDPGSLISKPFANDELLAKLGAMLASEAEV